MSGILPSGLITLSVHLDLLPNHEDQFVLGDVSNLLADRFGIHHSTIQIERGVLQERLYHDGKGTT